MTSLSFGELLDTVRDLQIRQSRLETDLQTMREQVALLTEMATDAPQAQSYPLHDGEPDNQADTPAFLKRQAK